MMKILKILQKSSTPMSASLTWWIAASRRPRWTRSSSLLRRWLDTVTRTCSCSSTWLYRAAASARWLLGGRGVWEKTQDADPLPWSPSTPAQHRHASLAPTSSVALAWLFQLLTCCVSLGRSLHLSGPQPWPSVGLGGPEDTARNQMTLLFPRRVWTELERSGFKSQPCYLPVTEPCANFSTFLCLRFFSYKKMGITEPISQGGLWELNDLTPWLSTLATQLEPALGALKISMPRPLPDPPESCSECGMDLSAFQSSSGKPALTHSKHLTQCLARGAVSACYFFFN